MRSTHPTSIEGRRLRSGRLSAAVLSAALVAAVLAPAQQAAGSTGLPAGIALTGPTGVGTVSDPFTYGIAVSCEDLVLPGGEAPTVVLGQAEAGKYYRFEVDFAKPKTGRICTMLRSQGMVSVPGDAGLYEFRGADGESGNLSYGLVQFGQNEKIVSDVVLPFTRDFVTVAFLFSTVPSLPDRVVTFRLNGPSFVEGVSGGGGTDGGAVSAAVATAIAQSNAAGIAGTSGGLLVRGGEVVPVVSSLASRVGPRGGVVLEAEGLSVSVASAVGARAGSGVVVPEGGSLQCSLCGDFVPGSVVEAWVNSDPRLAAAVAIPADAVDGDCHLLDVPTGAPLDGGGPIEAGAHTLQLRMDTKDGFAVLSTGITIGALTPTGVPAGDGPMPLSGVLGGLLVLLGAAALGLRSAASRGERACAGSAVIG